jgi:hypothetical protein
MRRRRKSIRRRRSSERAICIDIADHYHNRDHDRDHLHHIFNLIFRTYQQCKYVFEYTFKHRICKAGGKLQNEKCHES